MLPPGRAAGEWGTGKSALLWMSFKLRGMQKEKVTFTDILISFKICQNSSTCNSLEATFFRYLEDRVGKSVRFLHT